MIYPFMFVHVFDPKPKPNIWSHPLYDSIYVTLSPLPFLLTLIPDPNPAPPWISPGPRPQTQLFIYFILQIYNAETEVVLDLSIVPYI